MQMRLRTSRLLIFTFFIVFSIGVAAAPSQELPNQYRAYADKKIDCAPCLKVLEEEFATTGNVERADIYPEQGLVIINMAEGTEMDALTVEEIFRLAKLKMKDFERALEAD